MQDNLNARDGSGDAGRERPRRASEQAQPLSDREVPLAGTATSEMINSWLDGEAPASSDPIGGAESCLAPPSP